MPLNGTDQGNIWNPSGGSPGVTDGTDPNTPANLAIRRDGDVLAYEVSDILDPTVLEIQDSVLSLYGANSIAGRGMAIHAPVANPGDDLATTSKIFLCNIVLCDATPGANCPIVDN